MDRLTGMRVFVKVAEVQSFSGAARQLGMSQATVSKHVQMLEDWLGARVLHRTTRRVALTEAGEKFFQQFSQVLEDIDAATNPATSTPALRGSVRLTAPVAFGNTRLGPLLADYLRQHPRASVSVSLFDRFADLREEDYDLAIRTRPTTEPGLVSFPLMPLNSVLCAAPDYLADHAAPMTPADLARHDCIAIGDAGEIWRFTGPDGVGEVKIHGRLRGNSLLLRREAARAAAGILRCAEYLVRDDLASGRLVRLLQDYALNSRSLHAVCPLDRADTPKVRGLIDYLAAQLND